MKQYHGIFLLALCVAAASQAQTTYEPFTFSTFAGTAGAAGSTDGTGSAARFSSPSGIAIDSAGNVYVADTFNNTIRKITPGAVVSTFAGTPGVTGGMDGTGAAAQFNAPIGLAVDSSDNVYVADSGNNTIRKITPGAVVTTLAGLAGSAGSTDGTGSGARFNGPRAVAVDSAFNVYVADTFNHTIRKITPGGVVTTFAGLALNPGSTNGTGSAARFRDPKGIAVDTAGNIYVGDTFNDTIRKITPGGAVTTLAGVAGSVGSSDGSAAAARFSAPTALTVDTSGNLFVDDTNNETIRRVRPNGFVTTVGGSPGLAGSTDGSGAAARFNAPQGITVSPNGTLFIGDTGNDTVRLGMPPTAQLTNISTRASVQTGQRVTIAGFIVNGTDAKEVVVRGLGPTLMQFGINGFLADPTLALHDANGSIATNDNWKDTQQAAIQATGFAPPNDLESAILRTLQPGNYTAILAGNNNASGIGLVEVYDIMPSVFSELANVSTRSFVGTGQAVTIGGLITAGGNGSTEILVRGLGPTLTQFGVQGVLGNPTIALLDHNGNVIRSNDNWKDSQQAAIQATGLAPPNDLEAAIVATVPAGNYTAILQGKNNGIGIGLVEIYNIK